MPFQVSPGVNVSEIDLTTIVPAVSTTQAGIAGVFRWGPANDRVLISNEDELVANFGRPTANNYETFFTASSFLAYGNQLYVVRSIASNTYNAVAAVNSSVSFANTIVKNSTAYEAATSFDANVYWIAKWAGYQGNSLKISTCESSNAYSASLTGNSDSVPAFSFSINSNTLQIIVTSATSNTNANTMANNIVNKINVGDYIVAGNSTLGTQNIKVTAVGAPSVTANSTVYTAQANVSLATTYNLSQNVSSNSVTRYWEYFNFVDAAPGTSRFTAAAGGAGDEMHVVVADEDGVFTGTAGQVLEVWKNLSRASDAKTEDGSSNFYQTVINQNSQYVWFANARSGVTSNTAANMTAITVGPYSQSFRSGYDGVTESTQTLANLADSYSKFAKTEQVDVSLILTGKNQYGTVGEGLANWIIDNVAEVRKDCLVLVSPEKTLVTNTTLHSPVDSLVTFRNAIHNSSYAVMDSGYKYMYDKYNDTYRYVPLNGDIGGTIVRTDNTRDPWFSPAGLNRGQIKNLVKLAYNPDKADRDVLYKADINPVVTFPGEGTILYGDKTLLGKPSAFDRINVRRLFIVLEKAISTSAKFTLFEFNDEFTRATFRNLVEPYLRDIKGRRGIYDFRVVCDETNNTPERIDRNEFWGDIYIKPARSINFIQLNFVAVRTGVQFDEIVGRF